LKGYKNRDTGGIQFRKDDSLEKMEVGCGQCLGCRLDHSRMWAMRISHESSLYEYSGGNCFITLTYRDAEACESYEQYRDGWYVPKDWSLDKTHVQKFFKRLRKAFPGKKIRYFCAGEYGRKCKHGIDVDAVGCPLCNTGRPHYHACVFNHTFDDLEPYQSDGGIIRYTSPTLERLWGYGFVDVGELNFNTASYTASYILKKVGGVPKVDHYMTYDLDGVITFIEPEFITMSRGNAKYKGQRCGIGAKWYEIYKDDVYPSDEVPVPGKGVMNGVPRYYDKILEEEDPRVYEEVKRLRRTWLKEHSEDLTFDRLMDKHICAKAKIDMFRKRDKL
jgi:hypothetical protein